MSEALQIVCPHDAAINRVPHSRLSESPRCGACKQPLFPGKPLTLTSASFERHLANDGIPLVVDFWATWCGPCRMMAPAFEQAAALLEPHYRLAKVDTDAEQALAARFGIRSIPTLVVFSGGREVARQSGAVTAAPAIAAWVGAAAPRRAFP